MATTTYAKSRKGKAVTYDVFSVRGLYTSLSDGWVYMNAHDCPQIPEKVSGAVARSFRMAATVAAPEPIGGSHSRQAAGQPEGEIYIDNARHAVADLVGASADRVVLGPSLPALYATLVAAMDPLFRYGSSAVVSRSDRPELAAAISRAPAQLRTAHADLGTGEVPAFQFDELIDGTTHLTSLSAAHGALGTVAPLADIIDRIHERSRAWVIVDATDFAPYHLIEFDSWGADIVGIELGAMGGPQIAALVMRDTAMFDRLACPLRHDVAPGLAGAAATTVDHYAGLVDKATGRTRRARLTSSMEELSGYLGSLRDDLYTFLGTLPAVHILGVTGEAAADASSERLPRLTFGVQGVPAKTVYERLFDNGIVTTLAQHTPLLTDMGIEEMGGAVTVGLSPYNTEADVEQLIRVVASLA